MHACAHGIADVEYGTRSGPESCLLAWSIALFIIFLYAAVLTPIANLGQLYSPSNGSRFVSRDGSQPHHFVCPICDHQASGQRG